ncbi:AraC family ligand binding domain-containing protein [Gallaecimonas mangrovi]|uniref:AraC family ligand binding domain-containing protein n=1 Tax=Gallaecimonas mangrovi TaxID=2291597 RepID=UPI000E2027C6|nr:AraC family ligand binding domain-containing protein [Gallaecimonas mangrovi]
MYLPLTLANVAVAKARLSARQRLDTDLLVLWQQGQGVVRLGKAYYRLNQGDLLWLPAGTLFALGAGDNSGYCGLWLSKRLGLLVPGRVGMINDTWCKESLNKAAQRSGDGQRLLLKALAQELTEIKPAALGAALSWPVTGSLAALALIEAGRQGHHHPQSDIDPRPLTLTPV